MNSHTERKARKREQGPERRWPAGRWPTSGSVYDDPHSDAIRNIWIREGRMWRGNTRDPRADGLVRRMQVWFDRNWGWK